LTFGSQPKEVPDMSRIAVVITVALILFFSGCAVSREERIREVQSRYPQWDQQTVEQVANARVEVGMTEEMVLAVMGRPGQVAREGNSDVWTYMSDQTDSWGVSRSVPTFFLYVENGKVVEIKGSQKRVVTPLLYSRS
jgi:outer membrane protein assembly factor BamE (lipoprotein component of BamABCDE complex)